MMDILVWLFESSLLIVMILGIRKFFTGKISYGAIYALWGIVLLRLVLPVNLFSTHLSLENLFVGEKNISAVQEQSSTEGKISSEKMYSGAAGVNGKNDAQKAVSSNDLKENTQKKGQQGEREDLGKNAGKRENANLPGIRRGDAGGENSTSAMLSGGHMAEKVIFALWACVAFVIFCGVTFSNFRFLRKVKGNRTLLGSQGRVKIYSADVAVPFLYGVFHPSVYLPESMLSLIEEHCQLSQVIAHELTHYRHKDNIWAMVRTAMLVVYWFNPLVWLAAWLSGKDAELYCDEATIRQIGEEKRFDYGEMLIHLAGGARQERFLYSAVFMSRRGKDMEKRIRAISEKRQYSRWVAVPLVILLLVAIGVTCGKAVSSSGQPDNTIDLVKDIDTTKTTEEMEAKAKEEAARQASLMESREEYQSFLNKNAKKEKYRYYSLVELEKGQYVLLTANHVMEVGTDEEGNSIWSTSICEVHYILSDNIVSLGKIACSSSGEEIHLWEDAESGNRKLVTNAHHSISRYSLEIEGGEAKLVEDIREEFEEPQKKEYKEWYDELWYVSPSIIFYTNPSVENVKKKEPQALELTEGVADNYAKRILSGAVWETEADVTGDGVKDTIRAEMDKVQAPAADTENSVTVISGSSGKEIYGFNVNVIHDSWRGVYLYKSGGHTSLMVWQPAMYQGIAKYEWEIFDVSEDGQKTILAQDSFSFDLNHVKEDDPEELEKFVEKLNSYLKDADRLAEVSDGKPLEGADYELGGHYKGEFDSEGNWIMTYTVEEELKAMREGLLASN